MAALQVYRFVSPACIESVGILGSNIQQKKKKETKGIPKEGKRA
jgi:hypothetical protein